MPEYRFLGVKTDRKKYVTSLAVLIATIVHLVTQALLIILGLLFFFPALEGEPSLWQMSGRPLIGAAVIAGALCALNIARIEKPWYGGAGWNMIRIAAAVWSGVAVLPALGTKNWIAVLMLLASFIYVIFPRRENGPKA